MEVISSFRYAPLANTFRETFSDCMRAPRRFSSIPHACISPMLSSCVALKPPVTGNCRATSASVTLRFQYVASIDQRSLNRPISVPTSHSVG